jgi:hypothetical protein
MERRARKQLYLDMDCLGMNLEFLTFCKGLFLTILKKLSRTVVFKDHC